MPAILVCTVTGRCLPVLEASIKNYCPDVELLIFKTGKPSFGESYNFAMEKAFEDHDELILVSDDVVLTPTSYQYLMDDVEALKQIHGDKLGIVGAHSDSAAFRQNIRYQNGDHNKLDHHYGKWDWENQNRESDIVAPIFCWISKKAFQEAQFPPTNWYSDDVICLDLNQRGFKNFISKSYVHHVGAQTVGRDFNKLSSEGFKWLCHNRPAYAAMWFSKEAVDNFLHESVIEGDVIVEDDIVVEEKPLKICVYAISKNEEQFVERFCQSAKDADLILIADTGSTDNTVEEGKKHGAEVYSICITPWRFDHARNAALSLVPKDYDVCVSIDLDEVLEPGWREEIEALWKNGATRMRYLYDWGGGVQFQYEKIHARHGYHWHHPCHEYPRPDSRITEVWVETDKLLVSHYPDNAKSRGQYLSLLELSVKEDPYCPRNAFYYARELYFYSRFQESIDACKKYLAMPTATWIDERGYAYRIIAKSYESMKNPVEAEAWHHRSCAEAPHIRESWMAFAQFFYNNGRWDECYAASKRALSIQFRAKVYTADPECWGFRLDDLAAISAYKMGMKEEAIKHGENALKLSPDDARLEDNLLWYRGEKS